MTPTNSIVLQEGHPLLYQVAFPVPHGQCVQELVQTMWQTMQAEDGIGLAANQVGVLKRVIILNVDGQQITLINPVVVEKHGGTSVSYESCLSFPGQVVAKKRWNKVRVTGYDADWYPVGYRLRGLAAFCAQHEVDHLNGTTIK